MGESKNKEVAWRGAVFEHISYGVEFLKCHGRVCFSSGVVKESIENRGWE